MTKPILSFFCSALILGSGVLSRAQTPPVADVVPFAGLSPQDACDKATLPAGFKMHVFAAEPDLIQPIAFTMDDRGRMWVVEGITYPKRRGTVTPPEKRGTNGDGSNPSEEQLKDIFGGADRILVFEDTDGDHKFDKKTVFLEHLNLVSGIEVGFGGVWIGAAPYLMFVPVKDWENPAPAGNPKIMLDGWDFTADTHETLNSFNWGPDGWLYGCHGVFCPSNVGKPGATAKERQWMDAGVWRYHPTRGVFEVFTEGGSNPWGFDFNGTGQIFAEMCVIPHFWQMIQGARLQRQGGEHFPVGQEELNRFSKWQGKPVHPYIYDDIKQHGDHVHWAGQGGPHAGNSRSDSAGGGHAHAGMMCYLGTSWPEEYRGNMFMGNIHGQRFNMDIPERSGSGYVGKHGKDFMNFNDTWSQTLNQRYDQDGSVFVIDWYDKNQCHNPREDGHDRSNGRIYKMVYNGQKVTHMDLAKASDEALVKEVISKNEFNSRHARRILQERAQAGKLSATATGPLRGWIKDGKTTEERLRALWALHLTTGLDARTAIENLKSPDEWVRGWTIQLVFEDSAKLKNLIQEAQDNNIAADPDLNQMAEKDSSALVRMFIASSIQRMESEEMRAGLVHRLLAHGEDAGDHNLPLMYWFAMEPLVAGHPEEALRAAHDSKIPNLLNFTTRRVAAIGTADAMNLITTGLGSVEDAGKQLEMLNGLTAALRGQRSVTMPQGWETLEAKLGTSSNPEVRTVSQSLSVSFGSEKARTALRKSLADSSAPAGARRAALDSLLGIKDAQLPATLLAMVGQGDLRGEAIRALAGYNDAQTPAAILKAYAGLDVGQKRDALNTLVSRPAYARALLEAVASGTVSAKDLTADIIRQLRGMKDGGVQTLLGRAYGAVRETTADKNTQIEKFRAIYSAGYSQPGNAGRGRVLFNRICAQCHTLFDSGGKVGPDITGANRSDIGYLLENMVDPNAVIPNEYRSTEVETKDGRSIVGIVKKTDDRAITVQTANELLVIPRNEVAGQKQTELSMMPEGLLNSLSEQEVRDLLYYVSRPGQVPLPAESKN